MNELTKGQEVYWTRISKKLSMYDVLDLCVRTIDDEWFTACDDRTKQSYIFSIQDINKSVFTNRNQALEVVKEEELKNL